jgi:hypothetical protein
MFIKVLITVIVQNFSLERSNRIDASAPFCSSKERNIMDNASPSSEGSKDSDTCIELFQNDRDTEGAFCFDKSRDMGRIEKERVLDQFSHRVSFIS